MQVNVLTCHTDLSAFTLCLQPPAVTNARPSLQVDQPHLAQHSSSKTRIPDLSKHGSTVSAGVLPARHTEGRKVGCSESMSYKNNHSNFKFLTAGLKLVWQTGGGAIFPPKKNFRYLTKAEARNINGPFNTQEKTHLQSQIYAAGHFVLHCGSAAGGRPWR